MRLESAVEQMYKGKERLVLLGLTGRTGSGCSTVARILETEKIENLDIRQSKEYDYNNAEERKQRVVYKYMKEVGRWKGFTIIEVSSVILSCALELGEEMFIGYIDELTSEKKEKTINIGDKEKVRKSIRQIGYMFQEAQQYSFKELEIEKLDKEELERFYKFYVNTVKEYKQRFKNVLGSYTCFEIEKDKMRGKQQNQYHLYTYLMQQMGNNVRCSGNPFDENFAEEKYSEFVKRIDCIIKIINKFNEVNHIESTRICIDAIRNPYEAFYFRDKYKAFHLMAISTEDADRKRRLKDLNEEELRNLDNIEYPPKMEKAQQVFYHQNISECLATADIHVYNKDIHNGKYFELTEQLIKYIALMLHPGLITPTNLERCMQLAYNAKFNSGCLSRQVGAVVTREDFSIQSVGWNDVPKGQISCNLRDVHGFCQNKDTESYSKFEIEDERFTEVMDKIDEETRAKTCGRCMAYCFKDIYNGIKGDKNQVYTRALHAEENAFLQISKYGGTQVSNGCLFTTASPCELCAKKAYQLGIRTIYYIDPYPGISQSHILSFGKDSNPQMKLFCGAIGGAYLDFYEPRVPLKDELEMLTGVKINDIINEDADKGSLEYQDIIYNKVIVEMTFAGNRNDIRCRREVHAEIQKDGIKQITKKSIWTGSAYDDTRLNKEKSDADISLIEIGGKGLTYRYNIVFSNEKRRGDKINYEAVTSLKDEKQVMEPYLAHMVTNKTRNLIIRIIVPQNLVDKVSFVEYADLDMKLKIDEETINPISEDEQLLTYEYSVENANVNYTYAIEWEFHKNTKEEEQLLEKDLPGEKVGKKS